jgi:hypothetical protein
MLDITSGIDILTKGGMLAALAIALLGGYRGWYVWGPTHDKEIKVKDDTFLKMETEKNETIGKLEKDRDYWKEFSLRLLTANEKTLDKVVDFAQKQA